jgi:hypothetical protein
MGDRFPRGSSNEKVAISWSVMSSPEVRRDDVDFVRLKRNLAVYLLHRHACFSGEYLGELACVGRLKVHDHHKSGARIRRDFLKELLKRCDAPGGGADADRWEAHLNLRLGSILLALWRLAFCHLAHPCTPFLAIHS